MGMFHLVYNFFVSRNMCLNLLSYIWVFWNSVKPTTKDSKSVLNLLSSYSGCWVISIFYEIKIVKNIWFPYAATCQSKMAVDLASILDYLDKSLQLFISQIFTV